MLFLMTRVIVSFISVLFLNSTAIAHAASVSASVSTMHTEIVESSEDHQALMLDHAGEALKQRLDMIQRATTQIELESWNFDTSKSSRLIVQALIAKKKANPDISIRILVDYFVDGGLAQLSPAIADKLAGFGIELRYYNQIPMIDFPKVDHRDHRKIFVIDGSEAIIGSRNLADEHFNLGHGFNFVDRDVWIKGPIVKSIEESFDKYWDSDMSHRPHGDFGSKDPDGFVTPNAGDSALLARVQDVGSEELSESSVRVVHHVIFATDEPHNSSHDRIVTPYVNEALKNVKTDLLVENYAFVADHGRNKIAHRLLKNHVNFRLLTNAYDNRAVYGLAWRQESPLIKRGMKMFIYNRPPQDRALDDSLPPSDYQIHTKTAIRDLISTDIGSYNWDRRSENINHEDILTIDDSDFAGDVKKSIESRIGISAEIQADGKTSDGQDFFGNLTGFKLNEKKFLLDLESPFAREF